ncbi:Hypothetical predicted protein [Mytilus galloprovincialis]|uniref:Uncharacterized protein n=1 Tax=Mytilus galloprovincialis TaxID=29158 RepID=A0A8B6HRT9_MYTGA|nr:Hypothetical predicted protein [Mytilus galloprovincialis]
MPDVVMSKDINYAGRGWKSLEQHLTKKLHLDNLKMRKTNHSLSGTCKDNPTCKNMKTACKQYKEELLKKKLINEEKKANLQIKSQEKTVSKRKAKELIEKAAKKARLGHITSASQKTKGH